MAHLLFPLTEPKEEEETKMEVTVRKAVETTSMEIQMTKTEEKGKSLTHLSPLRAYVTQTFLSAIFT